MQKRWVHLKTVRIEVISDSAASSPSVARRGPTAAVPPTTVFQYANAAAALAPGARGRTSAARIICRYPTQINRQKVTYSTNERAARRWSPRRERRVLCAWPVSLAGGAGGAGGPVRLRAPAPSIL
ncbi:hypothetical protein EVAR_20738_1 [Eumeta japonica]|uniref:Uncharacterized protein n=1 Tax=Eumeta variegata TaxID=151549 RepID=A0A4C1VCM0_EUMVA|nr:hypothetical protein EVAR_20738_1 [Eumeta japonica]